MNPLDLIPSQVKLVAGIVIALAAAAAFAWFVHHIEQRGYQRGKAEIQAAWDKEKVKAQQVALEAQERNRATERAMAESVEAVAAHYREVNQREKDSAKRALDAIRTSGQRLSIPAACPAPSGGGASSPAPTPAGTTVPVRAELQDEASIFLVGEADRANEAVRTLNLCVETLAIERKKWPK